MVSSRHRLKGGRPSNFSVIIPAAHQALLTVKMVSATMTNLIGNVSAPRNVFYFYNAASPGVVASVSIPAGQYAVETFATALNTALLAGGAIAALPTTAIDAVTGRLNITFAAGITPLSIEAIRENRDSNPSSINELLGIPWDTGAVIGTTYLVNLTGPKIAFVCCHDLAPGALVIGSTNAALSSLGAVPLGGFGDSIRYIVPDTSAYTTLIEHTSGISSLSIQLQDEFGEELVLPDNADFSVEMVFIYHGDS